MNVAAVESLLSSYKGENPGCAVVIIRDGKKIFEYCAGYADLEQKTLVTPHTNFRLASVSKQFTASAVMLLVQERKISLDDTLETFFHSIPHYARSITVQELLTHTSGIIDYETLLKHFRGQVHDDEVLDFEMNQDHGYFKPGKGYEYSNGAYCILELIVEKVSGVPFFGFMHRNFFKPLGMGGTVIDVEGATEVPHRAYGYSFKGFEWIRTDEDQTSATIGDGGVYSSTTDMVKWNNSLDQKTILSKETLEEVFSRHVLTDEDDTETYYGFGFFLKNHHGWAIQYHGGSSIGFRNGIYRVPECGVAVVFLSNRNEGEGSIVAEKIMDIVLDSQASL